jgi:hypothetical protein
VVGESERNDEALESLGDFGGDAVCWAHLLCPECGIVLNERAEHRVDCSLGAPLAFGRQDRSS